MQPLRWFQSAPLVAEGRCLAQAQRHAVNLEVSIRAPRCRGAMRLERHARRGPVQVSIRAPRCRGAMPATGAPSFSLELVSIRAPRCRGAMPVDYHRPHHASSFQSAPLVAEGRCAWLRRLPRQRRTFQSAPLVAEGRCRAVRLDEVGRLAVSIRAPRCRGAMPEGGLWRIRRWLFQSAPLVAEGRCFRASEIR